MSRGEAFTLPHLWDGINCLLPLRPDQLDIVEEIMQAMGGSELLEFNSRAFRTQAEHVYNTLHISKLTYLNVWHVFGEMIALMYNNQ